MSAFELKIPLDASKVDERQEGETLRVSGVTSDGVTVSDLVKFGRRSKATATLQFKERPKSLKVHIGPGSVDAEELPKLRVYDLQVSPGELQSRSDKLTLKPVIFEPRLWRYLFLLCRTFTVEGQVTCPDGQPVAGAEVTAFDVDFIWWWSSKQQVGTAITDEQGRYEITFTWCCGYWPWWWWHRRHWRLDPLLLSEIDPILQLAPGLIDPPKPTPTPSLKVFEQLLDAPDLDLDLHKGDLGTTLDRPSLSRPDSSFDHLSLDPRIVHRLGGDRDLDLRAAAPASRFDPGDLVRLREPLLRHLPAVEQLHRLRIWPWYPWYGWRDCNPDLIFRITQPCGDDPQRVLVDEGVGDTRWNVLPYSQAHFTVEDGCCVDNSPVPPGECLLLTHVCGVPNYLIGGNFNAPPTPEGYARAGSRDQPFARTLSISGEFGFDAHADSDYYEIEWLDDSVPGGEWKALPAGSFLGFNRTFYGPDLMGGSVGVHSVGFPVQEIGGRRVIETRHHFEANHGAGTWHTVGTGGRWWSHHKTLLGYWRTDGFFADDVYRLRVKTWTLSAPDTLINPRILDLCGSGEQGEGQGHELVLRIDNQVITTASAHGSPCGPGTVHTCTLEPETQILEMEIRDANGVKKSDLDPCSEVSADHGDELYVRFIASDVDGHLDSYSLQLTYGENQRRVLIGSGAVPGASHGAVPPATTPVGPGYSQALGDGAVRPHWYGGEYQLTVPVSEVFPVTCCYQLELRAYKRTIVNCSNTKAHRNLSERSFMVRRS